MERRSWVLVPTALGIALLLGACTSSPTPTSSSTLTASQPSASPATAGASSSTQTNPSANAVAEPTAALRSCAASNLALSDTGADERRDGLAYGTIAARNTSASTCTITGYAGVVLLAGRATTATTLSRAKGSTPHTVTLKPGQSVSFGFSRKAYGQGAHCDQITGARIYDPDGSGYQTIDTMFKECEGITAKGLNAVPITVGPFQAGAASSLI